MKQILKSKLPNSTEIELHLFEFCNLNCAFCGQDHDSIEGMNTIPDKAYQVINFIKNSNLNSHIVNIMGGEIFNDLVSDNIFNDYMIFFERIKDYCIEHDQVVRFNWVTNLIFDKTDRVSKLIKDTAPYSWISTSYDFSGRGLNKSRSSVLLDNIELFKDNLTVIGFVLTKPAIRKLLRDDDDIFKNVLYKNYILYFDYYVPELGADKLMPSEQEMLDAMNFIKDNYPNIYPVKDLIENEHNKMTCYSLNKVTILPDGEEVTCRYMKYKKDDFDHKVDYKSNENIIEAHLVRNGCFSCEYYNKCSFRCFVQADWADLERNKICIFKEFFDGLNT